MDLELEADGEREGDDAAMQMIDGHCTVSFGTGPRNEKSESSVRQLRVDFDRLRYSVPKAKGKCKEILHGVFGCFRGSKLTVIIGPSGAGKTTLLSVVRGLKSGSSVKGCIKVNGDEINKCRSSFRKDTCYIPQEFVLMPLLTTRETLYIAARLKLCRGKRWPSARSVSNEMAEELGLTSCLDTLVANLSSGERKRLSMGVEMVTKPSVLLLDEPTSGLDSAASNQVISLLRNMTEAGCTVVCAVHQPSSQMMSQFDDIIVLAEGRTVYCGPRDEILETFSAAGYACPQFYNIAEFVLEVVTKQRHGDLTRLQDISYEKYVKWKSREEARLENVDTSLSGSKEEIARDHRNCSRISVWEEQKVLFYRAVICIRRDATLTTLRLAAHIVVAILLGAVFYDFGNDASRIGSNVSCVFFFLMFLFFANSMPAVQMFPVEAAVFVREHSNNWYRLVSYYSVKVISDLPMQVLCATVFLSIGYYVTGQPLESDRFLRAWVVCVLITIVGQSVGIAAGAAFDTQIGTFLIPASSIPMLLFAGFFLKLGEMAACFQPLGNISFFRYAFEGFMQAIYGADRSDINCSTGICLVSSPRKVLSMLDMPSVTFHTVVIVLSAWIVSLHLTIYSILRWKLYRATR